MQRHSQSQRSRLRPEGWPSGACSRARLGEQTPSSAASRAQVTGSRAPAQQPAPPQALPAAQAGSPPGALRQCLPQQRQGQRGAGAAAGAAWLWLGQGRKRRGCVAAAAAAGDVVTALVADNRPYGRLGARASAAPPACSPSICALDTRASPRAPSSRNCRSTISQVVHIKQTSTQLITTGMPGTVTDLWIARPQSIPAPEITGYRHSDHCWHRQPRCEKEKVVMVLSVSYLPLHSPSLSLTFQARSVASSLFPWYPSLVDLHMKLPPCFRSNCQSACGLSRLAHLPTLTPFCGDHT